MEIRAGVHLKNLCSTFQNIRYSRNRRYSILKEQEDLAYRNLAEINLKNLFSMFQKFRNLRTSLIFRIRVGIAMIVVG